MIALGHSSVGVLVAAGAMTVLPQTTSMPVALATIFVVGILSHYITDAIPHGHYDFVAKNLNPKSLWLAAFDIVGVFGLFFAISAGVHGFGEITLAVLFGMAGAQLPDVVEGLVDIGVLPANKWLMAHRNFHFDFIHWHKVDDSPLESGARPLAVSDIWQIAVFGLAIFVLFSL